MIGSIHLKCKCNKKKVPAVYSIIGSKLFKIRKKSHTGYLGILFVYRLSYYRTRSYSSNNSSFLFYLDVISFH